MLDLTCPNCRKLLQVADTATDRDSQCPACGTVFRPDAVWRPQLGPAPEIASSDDSPSMDLPDRESETSIDEEIVRPAPGFSEPTTDHFEQPPRLLFEQPPRLLWRAGWGFTSGVLLALALAAGVGLRLGNRRDVADEVCAAFCGGVACFGLNTAAVAIVHSLMFYWLETAAEDQWLRRLGRVSTVTGIVVVLILSMLIFTQRMPVDQKIVCGLFLSWAVIAFGVVFWVAFGVLGLVVGALRQTWNGLNKAAGRPSAAAREAARRRRLETLHEYEDQP
jgi:hypothetical protein